MGCRNEWHREENEGLKNADAYKLDSFSLAQLVLMQKVLRAMDEGRYLVARSGSSDSDVGSQLAERDVLDWIYDGDGGGSYSMSPEWVAFMRRNEQRIEMRVSELVMRAGISAIPPNLT